MRAQPNEFMHVHSRVHRYTTNNKRSKPTITPAKSEHKWSTGDDDCKTCFEWTQNSFNRQCQQNTLHEWALSLIWGMIVGLEWPGTRRKVHVRSVDSCMRVVPYAGQVMRKTLTRNECERVKKDGIWQRGEGVALRCCNQCLSSD